MYKLLSYILVFTLSIPCLGQNIDDLRKIFEYDKGQDLDYRILSTKDTIQGTINEIIYSSVSGLKVTARLIIPKQKIREFPAVIFLNDASQGRNAFVPQALDLANNAFASLLIDALPDRPEECRMQYYNFSEPRKDFSAYRQAVLDIRRGIDLLEQHERIDRNRIAFIGSGSGAMTGAIAAGVETRINTYILLACSHCYSCDLRLSNNPVIAKARNALTSEQINQYESVIKLLNPSNYLPNHRRSLIFFQFAQNDPYYHAQTAMETFQITKDPKSQKYYKTTNLGLTLLDEAVNDRISWLKNHL
jgi:hypothetical protein